MRCFKTPISVATSCGMAGRRTRYVAYLVGLGTPEPCREGSEKVNLLKGNWLPSEHSL